MSEINPPDKYKAVDHIVAGLPPLGSQEFWQQMDGPDRPQSPSVYVALMREFYGRGQGEDAARMMVILVEMVGPLAERMVSGWGFVRHHPEIAKDLVQTVWLNLVVMTQNGRRSGYEINFYRTFRYRLIDAMRAELPKYINQRSLDAEHSGEGDESFTLGELLPDPKGQTEVDLLELVQLLKQRLDPNELKIIELRGMDYNYSQIAQILGVDRQTVTRRLQLSQRKIGDELGRGGLYQSGNRS